MTEYAKRFIADEELLAPVHHLEAYEYRNRDVESLQVEGEEYRVEGNAMRRTE